MMKIRVEIAEKPYRLTIPADEEEKVRRAAKHIKEEIDALKRNYDASLTEYLAMAPCGSPSKTRRTRNGSKWLRKP